MSNVVMTSVCNRNCDYCFTRSLYPRGQGHGLHMPLDRFEQVLDFLERSGTDRVPLLGGEPTLHPDFPHMVDRVLARHLDVLVFSNGLMPSESLDVLATVDPERILVLINATDREALSPKEQVLQDEVLRRLGPRAMLGLNIYSPRIPLENLIPRIEEFGLAPALRLGLAHPCLTGGRTGNNRYLRPRNYPLVGEGLSTWFPVLDKAGIHLEFDCGFVPCMFPEEAAPWLDPLEQGIGLRCNPLVDILPDGRVISCFPLAELHTMPLDAEPDAARFRARFEERLARFRTVGIHPQCRSCEVRRQGACHGGCLAAAMTRLARGPFHFEVPDPGRVQVTGSGPGPASGIQNDIAQRWVIPYIDRPLEFWQEIALRFGPHVKEIYFPLPGKNVGSGRPDQPSDHLDAFLSHAPLGRSVLVNPVVLPGPVEDLAPDIIQALQKLVDEHGIQGITVSNLELARHIRDAGMGIPLTASVLMDVFHPHQAMMLEGICETLVPAGRIMRDLPALNALRQAFSGKIRLIVNEACLPHCLFRTQHFFEMNRADLGHPRSLCRDLLDRRPWLRLTGAWVLPQHLHLYDRIWDELKLAGRATLRNPEDYFRVLNAYVHHQPLTPDRIGGGPASVLTPMEIEEDFFRQTLYCGRMCQECVLCRDYHRTHQTE